MFASKWSGWWWPVSLAVRHQRSWLSPPINPVRPQAIRSVPTSQLSHWEWFECLRCNYGCKNYNLPIINRHWREKVAIEIELTVNAKVKGFIIQGLAQSKQGLPVLCHHHAGRPSECYYAVWFECQPQGHSILHRLLLNFFPVLSQIQATVHPYKLNKFT